MSSRSYLCMMEEKSFQTNHCKHTEEKYSYLFKKKKSNHVRKCDCNKEHARKSDDGNITGVVDLTKNLHVLQKSLRVDETDLAENIPPDENFESFSAKPNDSSKIVNSSPQTTNSLFLKSDYLPGKSINSENCVGLSSKMKRNANSPLRPVNDICLSASHRERVPSLSPRKVMYVWSSELGQLVDCLPRLPGRATCVHSLIEAYGLMHHLHIMPPLRSTKEDLLAFHSQEFVDFLDCMNDEDDSEKEEEKKQQFGIGYDCPAMPRIFDFGCLMTGATLRAAKALIHRETDLAVNWCGGWHHGKRDEAAGFCYVNDVVLAILKLREHFDRVLYIDLDLHHGDAVEDAFCYTPKVMTVSFHKHSAGFYPGSGCSDDVGLGRGRFYAINIPLQDAITDALYYAIFVRVMKEIKSAFPCDALVVQCGADTLAGDPMNSFNLTTKAPVECLQFLLKWHLPTLVLGGGGYHNANTARCWTQMTAMMLGLRLQSEIPDHAFFLEYGPDYQLDITPTNRPDLNSKKQLKTVLATITENLKNVQRQQEKLSRTSSLD